MHDINPATGLPMINDIGGVDVGGSPYGTDIHHHPWSASYPTWDSGNGGTL